jgi:hypothetical protein
MHVYVQRDGLMHVYSRTVEMVTPSFLAAARSLSGSAGSTQAVAPVLGCPSSGGVVCGVGINNQDRWRWETQCFVLQATPPKHM